MDFSNYYKKIQNSVIRVLSINQQGSPISSGSGVLIDSGKKAITCSHCVVPGTNTFAVLSGSTNGHLAKIIFNDPVMDIAILEFEEKLGEGVIIANSNNIAIGQEAFVVGFPSHTNSISAMGANIAGFKEYQGINLLMIDASVNHGNSGGPLFNSNGELIGIVNSKFGNLSNFLHQIQQAKPQASVSIGGINPIQVIQQLITEMKTNLNLGMGSAIPINAIADKTKIISELIS